MARPKNIFGKRKTFPPEFFEQMAKDTAEREARIQSKADDYGITVQQLWEMWRMENFSATQPCSST